MTVPLRRMTLHFSQIGLTDGLTFMFVYLLNCAEYMREYTQIQICFTGCTVRQHLFITVRNPPA